MFTPKLEILPIPQQTLWPELSVTPGHFTLYGGTAVALRLGHRFSVDFDFFSTTPFLPADLTADIPYLSGSQLLRSQPNSLTARVDRKGPVKLQFFGGLHVGQVEPAEPVEGPLFMVASLLDLAGMKAAVVTQRAELKDYLDIHALLRQGGIGMSYMLAAAAVIYGGQFNPLIALKAISFHDDPGLSDLPQAIRGELVAAVRSVDVAHLPKLGAVRTWEESQ